MERPPAVARRWSWQDDVKGPPPCRPLWAASGLTGPVMQEMVGSLARRDGAGSGRVDGRPARSTSLASLGERSSPGRPPRRPAALRSSAAVLDVPLELAQPAPKRLATLHAGVGLVQPGHEATHHRTRDQHHGTQHDRRSRVPAAMVSACAGRWMSRPTSGSSRSKRSSSRRRSAAVGRSRRASSIPDDAQSGDGPGATGPRRVTGRAVRPGPHPHRHAAISAQPSSQPPALGLRPGRAVHPVSVMVPPMRPAHPRAWPTSRDWPSEVPGTAVGRSPRPGPPSLRTACPRDACRRKRPATGRPAPGR